MPYLTDHLDLPSCPHCGVDTPNLERQWWETLYSPGAGEQRLWGAYRCARCGDCVLAVADGRAADQYGDAPPREVLAAYPAVDAVHPDVPPPARIFLAQAIASRHA